MSKDNDKTQIDPLLLQAYFDDELSADERQQVETTLESSDTAPLQLEALAEMRDLVRFDTEQGVEAVDLGGLWHRIESNLDEPATAGEAETNDNKVATPEPTPPGGFWESVKRFFDVNKGVLVPAMVALGIAALVVIPVLLNQSPQESVVEKDQTIVIVEPLRFEGNSMGAVSYTPETQTPVIWYLGGDGPQKVQADPETLEELRQLNVPIEKFLPLHRLDQLGIPAPRTNSSGNSPEGPI